MPRLIHLKDLNSDRPGMSASRGRSCAEAASVCFQKVGHRSGVSMRVEGNWPAVVDVRWKPLGKSAGTTWTDLQEAAEHGAYGLAALLLETLADLTVVIRSVKGTGFDYWVADLNRFDPQQFRGPEPRFKNCERVEVSGMLQGDDARVSARVEEKKRQTDRSKGLKIPAIVIVVEYGTPQTHMVRR